MRPIEIVQAGRPAHLGGGGGETVTHQYPAHVQRLEGVDDLAGVPVLCEPLQEGDPVGSELLGIRRHGQGRLEEDRQAEQRVGPWGSVRGIVQYGATVPEAGELGLSRVFTSGYVWPRGVWGGHPLRVLLGRAALGL